MRNPFLFVAIAIVVTAIAVLVIGGFAGAISAPNGTLVASLASASALALVIGGGTVRSYRGRSGQMLVHAGLWAAICLAVALVYRWREPLSAAFGLA